MSEGCTVSTVGAIIRSSQMFRWDSMTPLAMPVVPEVNSSTLISLAMICASKKAVLPARIMSLPSLMAQIIDRTGSRSASASMSMMMESFVSPLFFISTKSGTCFFAEITQLISASMTCCLSSFTGSSLSRGTTTPVPQTTAIYATAH